MSGYSDFRKQVGSLSSCAVSCSEIKYLLRTHQHYCSTQHESTLCLCCASSCDCAVQPHVLCVGSCCRLQTGTQRQGGSDGSDGSCGENSWWEHHLFRMSSRFMVSWIHGPVSVGLNVPSVRAVLSPGGHLTVPSHTQEVPTWRSGWRLSWVQSGSSLWIMCPNSHCEPSSVPDMHVLTHMKLYL